MIGGETASRILKEVMRGMVTSDRDSHEEKEYRESVARGVDAIARTGGAVDLPKEWP